MLIQCSQPVTPCPAEMQVYITQFTVEHFAELGITPETLLAAYSIGMGLALLPSISGYVLKTALALIRQL